MKRLRPVLFTLATFWLFGGCAAVTIHTPHSGGVAPTTTIPVHHDLVFRWMCPTFTYDSRGHQQYVYLNDVAFYEQSKRFQALCVAIPATAAYPVSV